MLNPKTERNYTVAGLEIRPLSSTDVLWLAFMAIVAVVYRIFYIYCPVEACVISFVIGGLIGFETISSPLGLRFRSVYFSLVWCLLCLLLIDPAYTPTYFALASFILYHSYRIIFRIKYKREFIPYHIGKGAMWPHQSKLESRSSTIEDKHFTLILLITGFLCFMTLLFGLVGKDFRADRSCGFFSKSVNKMHYESH